MLKIWKTEDNKLLEKQEFEPKSWICMVCPTDEELNKVYDNTKIHFNLLKKVLDRHETARIEKREESNLIVLSIPFKKEKGFRTIPIGIILSKENIVTIVNNEKLGNSLNRSFFENHNLDTTHETSFMLELFLEVTSHYQTFLNEMQTLLEVKEKNLLKATSNEDMKELLEIQKSFVYFIKALNNNEVVFEKMIGGNLINLNNNEMIMLEDTIIENRQAIHMATLYQDLLKSVMDSYETIISNNLNKAMKFLTGITIVFTIPTMVSSFMGMNVDLGYFNEGRYAFPLLILISLFLSLIVAFVFKRKNWL